MKPHHIERRKKWLECSDKQYGRLPSPEKTYLLSSIRDYARLCFIERRDQDLNLTIQGQKALVVLWVFVAIVGGVAFSSLPLAFLDKIRVPVANQPWFAYPMGAVIGVVAHVFVSTCLKELILKRKYTILKEALDNQKSDPSKPVKQEFYTEQTMIFESVEKELKKYPSPITLIPAIAFSIVEFATVWSILSRSSSNKIDIPWVIIGCALSLLLLWGLSLIKAAYFLVPKDCQTLRNLYIDERGNIDELF